jgi:predicted GH43/DUF377 family glycosyl hydrolase
MTLITHPSAGGTPSSPELGTAAHTDSPLILHPMRLEAAPERVVIRPFHLGWQDSNTPSPRARRLVSDVLALSRDEVRREYNRMLDEFDDRHWRIEAVFDERFAQVSQGMDIPSDISMTRKRLIGAYFCHEYSYAAAALMNPSVVEHPDQTGLKGGAKRFVMSMRSVGEGHISTVAFREGIIEPDGTFNLWPEPSIASSAQATALGMAENDEPVEIFRHEESTLSGTVIFPVTEQQRGGLEDLRLVRFSHGNGDYEWVGTYTAYSGREIRSELMRTRDFRKFTLEPIHGKAGRNKGMALFPKRIGGKYVMLGRQDGKNLFLLHSDKLDTWDDDGKLLIEPKYPWEFIQIGNCGSPILCDEGWLVLTHGVGAMRKYSIGALLLDAKDPSKVLGRSVTPLLAARDNDRAGYVPNVVYSCGGMRVGKTLFLPYGLSDSAIGFATARISDIVATLR